MKESKKGTCIKCGLYFYIDEHHILPQAHFGKKGETVPLCPNCHRHFHEFSKQHTTNPTDKEEALKIWQMWYDVAKIVVTSVLVGAVIWALYGYCSVYFPH